MEKYTNLSQNKTVSQTNPQEPEEGISLRDFLEIFTSNWQWFLASVIICVICTRIYLATKPYIYRRQAVMLVKESDGSSVPRSRSIGNDALMQLNGVMVGSSVKNELYILRSHLLMKEVVRTLHLDVLYSYRKGLQVVSLYNNRPFDIQFAEEDSGTMSAFKVQILNEKECKVSLMVSTNKKFDYEKIVRFDQIIETPVGKFKLIPIAKNLNAFIDETINITHIDNESAANMIGGRISTNEVDKMSSLVNITCTDTNIQRADDILSALLNAYKQSIIDDKNILAQSTADFIDERIQLISRELNEVEGNIAQFKQNNNLVDISSNAQAVFTQYTKARQHTIDLQAQKVAVEYLLQHLKKKSEGYALIPTVNITDGGSQSMIGQYNQLMLERNRLVENSGETSSTIKELDSNLSQLRQATITSVQAYLASIDVQIQHSLQEENTLQKTLSTVPQKEKIMLDIARQQAIKETLYTYLLNKREETALQLAISEANIRIIEQPYGSTAPFAPRKSTITCGAALVGFALPFAVFFLINMLNVSVRGRKEIEMFTTIPVIGDIPHIKGDFNDSGIVVSEKSNDPVNEAFRMLRFNLSFVKKDARVIMFTSTMPGEGKTFISRNFAYALSLIGKRVLLIDTDIRKRTQTAALASTHKEGLTSYLNGTIDNPMELVVQSNEGKNKIDLLPAGLVPPNPAELLMSERLDELVEKLKEVYDYIILDNVPAQMVADAAIVNRVADLTIYVVRTRKLDRRFLPELERLYQEKKFSNLTILINDAEVERKYYGYGNYAYYGYYGYSGYGYGYGSNKKKKRFSFKW